MPTRPAGREELRVGGLPEPLSHYTDAVRFGDLLYVSGCAPLDSEGSLVAPDDAVAQARQVLANLGLVLDAAGASFADVLKITVFLTDVTDRVRIDSVRRQYFGAHRPASTLVEVSALALPEMRVEIEAIVGLPAGGNRVS